MERVTKKIVDFTLFTKFNDLSQEIVNKMKLVLLDSIGCALASYVVDRARLALQFAETLRQGFYLIFCANVSIFL